MTTRDHNNTVDIKLIYADSSNNVQLGSANSSGRFQLNAPAGSPQMLVGNGSPNTVVSASPGSLYLNVAGGTGTTLYVKESGSGNTGWVGK